MSDSAEDIEEGVYWFSAEELDPDLEKKQAEARRQQQELGLLYQNARTLNPRYTFNRDVDKRLDEMALMSKKLADNLSKVSDLTNQIKLESLKVKTKVPSEVQQKQKPKQQLSIQESIDLQQKILSGSG